MIRSCRDGDVIWSSPTLVCLMSIVSVSELGSSLARKACYVWEDKEQRYDCIYRSHWCDSEKDSSSPNGLWNMLLNAGGTQRRVEVMGWQ